MPAGNMDGKQDEADERREANDCEAVEKEIQRSPTAVICVDIAERTKGDEGHHDAGEYARKNKAALIHLCLVRLAEILAEGGERQFSIALVVKEIGIESYAAGPAISSVGREFEGFAIRAIANGCSHSSAANARWGLKNEPLISGTSERDSGSSPCSLR